MEIKITKHAFYRANQRFRISKMNLPNIALLAFINGINQDLSKGKLFEYFDKLLFDKSIKYDAKLFYGKIFIFYKTTLITLFKMKNIK